MTNDELQAEIIRRAVAGDQDAGLEALRLCQHGLDHRGGLSDALRHYLAERIGDVLAGVSPAKALCIAKERGRPKDPFPDWQKHLGAFAALLSQRGYKPQQIAKAMCDQRAAIHDKSLENSDAHAIRKAWSPMQSIDSDTLNRLAGPYRKVLSEYPPLE